MKRIILLNILKLTKYRFKNNLLNYQNNYIENSSMTSNAVKNFEILIINLTVLYDYFGPIKLFSDMYFFKLNSKILQLHRILLEQFFKFILKMSRIRAVAMTRNIYFH